MVSSVQPPRFFTFVAVDGFDGTTEFDAADLRNSPDNRLSATPVTSSQPRLYGYSEGALGRFGFDDLVRPGNVGAIVMLRLIGGQAAETDRVEVRTAAASELVADEQTPTDQLQQSVLLDGEWSEPLLLEPRDALCIYHDPERSAAIQIIVHELDQHALGAWITAKAKTSCCSSFKQSLVNVTIDEDDEEVAITTVDADLITVQVSATKRGTVRLPAWADLRPGTRIDIVRLGGTVGAVRIDPVGFELMNGGSTIVTPLYLPRVGAVRVVREAQATAFSATTHNEPVAETVAEGDKTYNYGWPGRQILRLTQDAIQRVTLPSYSTANNVPLDCSLLVVNPTGSDKVIAVVVGTEAITGDGATDINYTVAGHSCAVVSFDGSQWSLIP